MRIDPDGSYLMPIAFGPMRPHAAGTFEDVLSCTVVYRSTVEALGRVLPEPFEPDVDPLVYVSFMRCRGINFLAGGGYNLLGVNVAARFKGQADDVRGQFTLVLWETSVAAILRGREILGVPKMFADIPDPVGEGPDWELGALENGNPLVQMRLVDTRELDADEREAFSAEQSGQGWFGWRYIPTVTGLGAAISEPTQIGIESHVERAWACHGEATFGDVAWESNPGSADVVAGLRSLPLLDFVRAYRTQGSFTLTRAKHRVLR